MILIGGPGWWISYGDNRIKTFGVVQLTKSSNRQRPIIGSGTVFFACYLRPSPDFTRIPWLGS